MIIDYKKLQEAREYYSDLGYREINMPWIVSYESYNSTSKDNKGNNREFFTLDGYLVASGEQSFIQEMLNKNSILLKEKSKYFCVTPCFRDDELDELHQKHFIKLELINTEIKKENLESMTKDSLIFFNKYLKSEILQTSKEKNTFDIIDSINKIELGSYGKREYFSKIKNKKIEWIYGTGIALPRLDIALLELKK